MGLPRKGTRRIVVAGQTYRWRLTCLNMSWQESCFWPLCLYVQRTEGSGQLLVVHFNYPVSHQVEGKEQYPTPGLVRRMIEVALSQGWQPSRRGLPSFPFDGRPFLPEVAPVPLGGEAPALERLRWHSGQRVILKTTSRRVPLT